MSTPTLVVLIGILLVAAYVLGRRAGKQSSDGTPITTQEFLKKLRKSERNAVVVGITPYKSTQRPFLVRYYILVRLGNKKISFSVYPEDVAIYEHLKDETTDNAQIRHITAETASGKIMFTNNNNKKLFQLSF